MIVLLKPGAWITHNATLPLIDNTGGNFSDSTGVTKNLRNPFFTDVVALPKTCKYTSTCVLDVAL